MTFSKSDVFRRPQETADAFAALCTAVQTLHETMTAISGGTGIADPERVRSRALALLDAFTSAYAAITNDDFVAYVHGYGGSKVWKRLTGKLFIARLRYSRDYNRAALTGDVVDLDALPRRYFFGRTITRLCCFAADINRAIRGLYAHRLPGTSLAPEAPFITMVRERTAVAEALRASLLRGGSEELARLIASSPGTTQSGTTADATGAFNANNVTTS